MTMNFICVISSVVNSVTSLVLGFLIWRNNPHSRLHRLWAWMSLAIATCAAGLAIAFGASPEQHALALFAVRFADVVAILIPLFYLHFITAFLQRTDQRCILRVCYTL